MQIVYLGMRTSSISFSEEKFTLGVCIVDHTGQLSNKVLVGKSGKRNSWRVLQTLGTWSAIKRNTHICCINILLRIVSFRIALPVFCCILLNIVLFYIDFILSNLAWYGMVSHVFSYWLSLNSGWLNIGQVLFYAFSWTETKTRKSRWWRCKILNANTVLCHNSIL